MQRGNEQELRTGTLWGQSSRQDRKYSFPFGFQHQAHSSAEKRLEVVKQIPSLAESTGITTIWISFASQQRASPVW